MYVDIAIYIFVVMFVESDYMGRWLVFRGFLTPLYRDDHFEMKGLLPRGEGPTWAVALIVCAMSAVYAQVLQGYTFDRSMLSSAPVASGKSLSIRI